MMQKSSTTQSPTQTTQASRGSHALHPVLQNVLVSLDVQLEEELFHYRRQRALGKTSYKPPDPSFRKISNALKSVAGSAAPISLPAIAPESSSFHPTVGHPPLAAIAPQDPDQTIPDRPDNSIDFGSYPSDEESTPDREAIAESAPPAASSFIELTELAKQYASEVANSSDLTVSVSGGPDDYLESSEELLRALSREEAEVQAEQSFMHSLLTPLGFGSMLLLLLSSAMFGFVITNPSSVSQLFASQESTRAPVNPTDAPVASPPAAPSDLPQPNLANQEFPELSVATLGTIKVDSEGELVSPKAGSVKAPASSSLVNIGLSGTTDPTAPLPTVTISPGNKTGEVSLPSKAPAGDVPSPRRLAPTAAGSAPAPSQRSTPSPARTYSPPPVRAYTPPAPVRSYNPAPVVPSNPPPRSYRSEPIQPFQPAPRRNPLPPPSQDRTPLPPAAPAPNNTTSRNSGSGYKVVSPYTSDRALEDARQQVPDAYVKNYPDGAKVQFGAYSDEASAEAQVEALQKQGIPAEVYRP